VIHTVLEEKVERSFCVCMGDMAECRRAEDRAGALVAGATEWRFRDQAVSLAQ